MALVFPSIQVDDEIRGTEFNFKAAVRLASTDNTNWSSAASAAFVDPTLTISALTAGASIGLIDSVEPVAGDRILLKDLGAISAGTAGDDGFNGIWEVTGGTATTVTLVRTFDLQVGDSSLGVTVWIKEGTVEALRTSISNSNVTITDAATNDVTFRRYDVLNASTGSTVNEIEITNALTTAAPIIGSSGEANIGLIVQDSNSNELLRFASTASAVNEICITNSIASVNPTIQASGDTANTGIILADSNSNEIVVLESVASAVNELTITNAATGTTPIIQTTGENDIGIQFQNSDSEQMLILASVATAVNELTISNAATGNRPIIQTTGETDIGIEFHNDDSEEMLILVSVATAVNEVTITNAATGVNPTIQSSGEANTGLILADSNSNQIVILESVASALNEITITNAATGINPTIQSSGEANTGIIFADSNSNQIVIMESVASAVNEVTITNAATGVGGPIIAVTGEANVGLNFATAGTGTVNLSAGSASTSGELRIEDNTGAQYVGITAAAATTSYTVTMPAAQGGSGEVLTNNGSGILSWAAAGTSRRDFVWQSNSIVANSTTPTEVAQFAWDDSAYGSFTTNTVIFWHEDVDDRNLTVEVFEVGGLVLGSVTVNSVAADAIVTFTFTDPVATDARIALRVDKSANGGTNPTIHGVQLSFT